MPELIATERFFGKYTGVVQKNTDDDNLGVIEVSVPAVFPSDDVVLARAALPYGFYFVPPEGAKVWVEFEGGDSSLPLWTGVQYVSGEWSPAGQVDPPAQRVIETAAGHRILFDDTKDAEAIQIVDGKTRHVITLDKDGIRIEQGNAKTTLTFDDAGVTLDCAGDLTLNAKGALTLEAKGNVTIKGANVTVDGSSSVTVQTTGQLTAKGNPIHLNP